MVDVFNKMAQLNSFVTFLSSFGVFQFCSTACHNVFKVLNKI